MQRHEVDPTSLAFGLVFALVGLLMLNGNPAAGTVWLGWIGPVAAIGLGLLIVLAVRPRRAKPADGMDETPAGDEG